MLTSDDGEQDRSLVARVLAGDTLALEDLLRRMACIPVILRVRNRRLGNPLDDGLLEDLAQETLVAIWQKLGDFCGPSSLEAWVYRFCLNKHLALVRNRGRRGSIEAVESELLEHAPAGVARAEVDDERLQHALAELEQTRAAIVRLKHFEELTFEEIAARLSISPNTAKTHYYRALKSMRDSLSRSPRRVP